jgi:hypothetical protein
VVVVPPPWEAYERFTYTQELEFETILDNIERPGCNLKKKIVFLEILKSRR